jgi:hypothetical protein
MHKHTADPIAPGAKQLELQRGFNGGCNAGSGIIVTLQRQPGTSRPPVVTAAAAVIPQPRRGASAGAMAGRVCEHDRLSAATSLVRYVAGTLRQQKRTVSGFTRARQRVDKGDGRMAVIFILLTVTLAFHTHISISS